MKEIKMTNEEILKIAMEQSAVDSGCKAEDFLSNENIVVISRQFDGARKYLKLPFLCDLASYGNNIVASVSPELKDIVTDYINSYPPYHCFETPNMIVLQEKLRPLNMNVCFMAEYWLPDVEVIGKTCATRAVPAGYELRVIEKAEIDTLNYSEWENALCEARKELDILAVAAYKNGKMIGLAGCSADCDTMWQIGIDVKPEYRRQGIASTLVNQLACECLERGKVPFYCCAWSNLKSVRTALKSGFRPAWVQLTVKQNDIIERTNKKS